MLTVSCNKYTKITHALFGDVGRVLDIHVLLHRLGEIFQLGFDAHHLFQFSFARLVVRGFYGDGFAGFLWPVLIHEI